MNLTSHLSSSDWQFVHAQRVSYGSLNRDAIEHLLNPIRTQVHSGAKIVVDLQAATSYGADLLGELVRLSMQLKKNGGRLSVHGDHLGLIALLGLRSAIEGDDSTNAKENGPRHPFRRQFGLQRRFCESIAANQWKTPKVNALVASH